MTFQTPTLNIDRFARDVARMSKKVFGGEAVPAAELERLADALTTLARFYRITAHHSYVPRLHHDSAAAYQLAKRPPSAGRTSAELLRMVAALAATLDLLRPINARLWHGEALKEAEGQQKDLRKELMTGETAISWTQEQQTEAAMTVRPAGKPDFPVPTNTLPAQGVSILLAVATAVSAIRIKLRSRK